MHFQHVVDLRRREKISKYARNKETKAAQKKRRKEEKKTVLMQGSCA